MEISKIAVERDVRLCPPTSVPAGLCVLPPVVVLLSLVTLFPTGPMDTHH